MKTKHAKVYITSDYLIDTRESFSLFTFTDYIQDTNYLKVIDNN